MPERSARLDDHEAHQRALEFLAEFLGEDCTSGCAGISTTICKAMSSCTADMWS